MKKLLVFLALLFASPLPVQAQNITVKVVASCGSETIPSTSPGWLRMDVTGKLCTAASVSATVGGFTPGLTFATLTATASSASVALPVGATVFFQNNGTTTVSCTLGIGSATATANEILVPASSGVPVVVGTNTFGACIDQSGSASNLVVLAGGSGLGSPFGGGAAGGGGAVTNAGTFAVQVTADSTAAALLAAVSAPVPACAAAPCVTTIGNTGQMANVGGTDTKSIKCGSSIVYDASTNGSTQLVALSGATSVYVCGYTIMAGGTVNVKLITGTGTACVTGTASITPAFQLTAQAGVADGANEYRGLKGASSSELCINTSAGVAVQAIVYYTQF
jgi:hypothetical protein